jgi:hypothetical protein
LARAPQPANGGGIHDNIHALNALIEPSDNFRIAIL